MGYCGSTVHLGRSRKDTGQSWGRAFISRYVSESDGSFSWESAVNATELEQAAMRAITAQGGSSSSSGTFPCPPELAAQARWSEED
jgi:hypothetical protein